MNRSIRTLALAALAAVSLPALAGGNPATLQWVVASAKATGGKGEDFVTSLRIVNPNTTSATVALTFLKQSPIDQFGNVPSDNVSTAPTVNVNVAAGQTLALDDVLGTTFALTAPVAGAIKVDSGTKPVSVLSQTLVRNARSADGKPGTNGFAIPAQIKDELIAAGSATIPGDLGFVPFVSGSSDSATGYRTNLFLLSTNASDPTTVKVRLARGDGSTVQEKTYNLQQLAQTQINGIAANFGFSGTDTNLTAYVTVTSGGPVAVGASVIDNAIASISYSPPSKVFVPNNGAFGLIFEDGGYGFSGRLDVFKSVPTFLSGGIVVEGCTANAQEGTVFFIQGFASDVPKPNVTFTRNADASYAIAGDDSDPNTGTGKTATYTGTLNSRPDGTVFGSITYNRLAGAECAGKSKTVLFNGARSTILE